MTTKMENIMNFKGDTDKLVETLFGDLPKYQLETNRKWLKNIHSMLNDGGTWMCPDTKLIFKKIGDEWAFVSCLK
jgi:hypothetical protein